MKTKQEILKSLFAMVAEYECCKPQGSLECVLKIKIQTLYDVLGEDVPEEYWDRIEEIIF